MGVNDHLQKMQVRQAYRNLWHSDLMGTMTSDPSYCCFACFCPQCASYMLRKRALYDDMSRYRCCAGYMPCSGKFGEKHCPAFCLCCEVWCCFSSSVSSTRFLIQDEFNIQTTPCDNCIIGCMICLNQIACIFSLIACLTGSDEIHDIADALGCIAETVYCSVCACMQTQHKLELNKRDGKFGPPQPVMAVPPMQQMSRLDQSPGYPQSGAPPMGYQPPPMGYPHQPPGYMPPPAYGQPMNPPSPSGGHDPYPPPPVAYVPQHPHHMYPPHGAYPPGPAPGAYPPGPAPGAYPPGPAPGAYPPGPGPDSAPFTPGPESGPYPPARPPPPPPGHRTESPSAPLPPHEEHPEPPPPSSNPPK